MMLSAPTNTQSKTDIRQHMRKQRSKLSKGEQKLAALALKKQLLRHPVFIRSQRIAFYLANDNEIDPMPLLQAAWAMGKQCYLPVLHPFKSGHLLFSRYRKHDKLIKNRYGIAEPRIRSQDQLKSSALDLVLTPLVAFDNQGNRLGMGGGYYDRTFYERNNRNRFKPILIGLSHECQKVDLLAVDSWDIPVTAIMTDRQIYQ